MTSPWVEVFPRGDSRGEILPLQTDSRQLTLYAYQRIVYKNMMFCSWVCTSVLPSLRTDSTRRMKMQPFRCKKCLNVYIWDRLFEFKAVRQNNFLYFSLRLDKTFIYEKTFENVAFKMAAILWFGGNQETSDPVLLWTKYIHAFSTQKA